MKCWRKRIICNIFLIALLVVIIVVPSATTGAIETTNQVGGVVWLDENKNNTNDEGEELLADIQVLLYEASDIENIINTVKTDENGKYNFEVQPGNYILKFVEAQGLQFPMEAKEENALLGTGFTKEIEVLENVTIEVNAGFLKIEEEIISEGVEMPEDHTEEVEVIPEEHTEEVEIIPEETEELVPTTRDTVSVSTYAALVSAISSTPNNGTRTIRLTGTFYASDVLVIEGNKNITITSSTSTRVNYYQHTSGKRHFLVRNGGKLTLENISLTRNVANTDTNSEDNKKTISGGVRVETGSTLTMKSNSDISNNRAYFGGGVEIRGGSFVMESGARVGRNCATYGFDSNGLPVNGSGGGVYVNEGSFNMGAGAVVDTNLAHNYPGRSDLNGSGGGVRITSGATFTMDGTIKENTSSSGAGLYIDDKGKGNIRTGAIIEKNIGVPNLTESGQGGGIYVDELDTLVELRNGAIIQNNEVRHGAGINGGQGGGIFATNNSKLIMYNGAKIQRNKANLGGGLYVTATGANTQYTTTVTMYNILVTENVASTFVNSTGATVGGQGGGVYLTTAGNSNNRSENKLTFNMSSGQIIKNYANNGGGVYATCSGSIYNSTTLAIYGASLISGHNVTNSGGGIYLSNRGTTVTLSMDSKIENNTSRSNSGGVHVTSGSRFSMLGNSIIQNTTAGGASDGSGGTTSGNGGGVYVTDGNTGNITTFNMYGNAKIQNTTANSNGGGVSITGNSHFTMSGNAIIQNTKTNINNGGGVYVTDGDNSTKNAIFNMLGDAIIQNTVAANNGGGVTILGNSHFTMSERATIQNAVATSNGGGVHIFNSAKLTMKAGQIINNKASNGNGGGVHVIGQGELHMADGSTSKIAKNTANSSADGTGKYSGGNGGGVNIGSGGQARLNGFIQENHASNGGGVYISGVNSKAVLADNVLVSKNKAVSPNATYGGLGGGVFATEGSYTQLYNNATITNNEAIDGGGLYITNRDGTDEQGNAIVSSTPTKVDMWSGGKITANTITGNGGGIYLTNSSNSTAMFNMTGGEINGNTGAGDGGGIYMEKNTTVTMQGGKIVGHKVMDITRGSRGAGVFMESGTFTMTGYAEISGNESKSYGGGVYMNAGRLSLGSSNAKLEKNRAGDHGGGVYVSKAAKLTMTAGKIVENTSAGDGGGIFTEVYEYKYILSTPNEYNNLSIASSAIFTGNMAQRLSEPPGNPQILNHINYATSSITKEGGYVHTLNNYDINYARDVSPITFEFYKVDDKLYENSPNINLLKGAKFDLYKYKLSTCQEHTETVTQAGIDHGCWELIDTKESDADGHIAFDTVISGEIYQLVEIDAPEGYQLPKGQWRVIVESADMVHITAIGDVPAFALIEGKYYVGNIPAHDLPLLGAIPGGKWMVISGMTLLAFGLSCIAYKISQFKKRSIWMGQNKY